MNLIFATGNQNKVREINLLVPPGITVQSLSEIGFLDDLEETSDTIEGNSLQKALFLYNNLGMDGFAEDTGLEVEALNGEPGIFSARYAGPQKDPNDNMDLLLQKMQGQMNRNARFRTVITFVKGGEINQFEGILKGVIGHEKKGDHGFGYDPVFMLDNGKSLAELSSDQKAAISHRAIAFTEFMKFLRKGYI